MKIRLPLLLLAILALLSGLWAGLLRLGWVWPAFQPGLPALHGPLMVSGFLGTLISLERAIALRQRIAYLPAILTGIGGGLLWSGVSQSAGMILVMLGSLGLVGLFGWIVWQHRVLHTAVMAVGTALWLVGNLLWLTGRPIHLAVWWWMGFLVLTIAGERLELNRVLRLTRPVRGMFLAGTAVLLAGLLLTAYEYGWGIRLTGLGLCLLGGWLIRYDLARHNMRKSGLTRFIAICLFSGYIWLLIGGFLAIWYGAVAAGLGYDAILHAVFLGFTLSMIFGHAPLIFPAILQRPLPYHPRAYAPLLLLHLSLLLRVAGDLFVWTGLRQWGGLLNSLVLLLFLGNTLFAVTRGPARLTPKKS